MNDSVESNFFVDSQNYNKISVKAYKNILSWYILNKFL